MAPGAEGRKRPEQRSYDHTIYEYVSIDDMCKVHEIVLNIVGEVSGLK